MGEQEDRSAKRCFVISPIGHEGSAVRERADKVYRHVIEPAVTACGYTTLRSDIEPTPGMIGQQIINHLLRDDLVVADLTGLNANVFYELAIRHMVRKPVVQLIEEGDALPFDITQSRTIFLDSTDLDSADACRREITTQIRELEREPELIENPVSHALEINALERDPDSADRRDADILRSLNRLNVQVEMILLDQRMRRRGELRGRRMAEDPVQGERARAARAEDILAGSVTLDQAIRAFGELEDGEPTVAPDDRDANPR